MAIRKVKYNDSFIFVEDEIDYKETGISINQSESEELEKTKEIDVESINEMENTNTDVFGDFNEW